MGGFWNDAWKAFKAVYGPILTGAAFILALLGAVYEPEATVRISVIWLAAGGVLLLLAAMTGIDMLRTARLQAQYDRPRVIHVIVDTAVEGGQSDRVILVLDRARGFGTSQVVTIEFAEPFGDGQVFERRMGLGFVFNLQQNGFVQIRVLYMVPNQDDLWQRIKRREAHSLAQVLVKPSIVIADLQLGALTT